MNGIIETRHRDDLKTVVVTPSKHAFEQLVGRSETEIEIETERKRERERILDLGAPSIYHGTARTY